MTKYILKRILIAIPTLLGITIIDYAIMCFAGSPLEMLQGARISQEAIAAKEAAMGLDKPFYIQYFIWLGQLLSGNMGYSVKSYEAVSAMIGSHLGPTLLLMGVSLIVSLIMSVPAGIYSAIHQYSKGDYAVVTASFFGSSIPGFFLSLLLVYLFTVNLGILPSGGMTTLGTAGGCGGPHGNARAGAVCLHGRDQYPLYSQRHAGNTPAGLSAHSQGQGNREQEGHI